MVLAVGENYVWCLVLVVIFMGIDGEKRLGMNKVLKSSYGGGKLQRMEFL